MRVSLDKYRARVIFISLSQKPAAIAHSGFAIGWTVPGIVPVTAVPGSR